jgi:plastocyanin
MNIGQAAVGLLALIVVVGGLLYIFYSRTSAVAKTGYGSLIMLTLVSLMIPVFWITESNNQAAARIQQQQTAVNNGMQLYAEFCTNCYGIQNDKVVDATYNGYTIAQLNNMSDNDLLAVIEAGEYNPRALNQPTSSNAVPRASQFGGALDSNDVDYLFEFLRSADPDYLSKNGYPHLNGFDQLPDYLQNNNPAQYQAAVNFAKQQGINFGTVVDLTNQKSITINIVKAGTNGVNCSSQVACFSPVNIKVKVGTTITWVNKDSVAHTVTAIKGNDFAAPQNNIAGPQVFDSGQAGIQSGKSFTYTVNMNAYNLNPNHMVIYYCRFHTDMLGVLTIVQ